MKLPQPVSLPLKRGTSPTTPPALIILNKNQTILKIINLKRQVLAGQGSCFYRSISGTTVFISPRHHDLGAPSWKGESKAATWDEIMGSNNESINTLSADLQSLPATAPNQQRPRAQLCKPRFLVSYHTTLAAALRTRGDDWLPFSTQGTRTH